jgi:hypothetical protein
MLDYRVHGVFIMRNAGEGSFQGWSFTHEPPYTLRPGMFEFWYTLYVYVEKKCGQEMV